MSVTVEAIYQNGLLKPKQALTLAEGAEVLLTIVPVDGEYDPLDAVIGICKGGPTDGAQNHDKYLYGKLRPGSSSIAGPGSPWR